MDGLNVDVSDSNDHFGIIVSGERAEEKNVDHRANKWRSSLFQLLGPAFAQKNLVSPIAKLHIFRLRTCPVTRSGLSALALRPTQLQPIDSFHKKVLRSFLSLSERSPIPALYFLTGEIPMSGRIHRDVFSIFYSIWRNPDTKIHSIVKYLLEESCENSRTWSVHVRNLALKYGIPDPLLLLNSDPMSKESFKEMISTRIVSYFEGEMRDKSLNNSQMRYLNVSISGLSGAHHPAISGVTTLTDVKQMRPHLKMLSGDYLTYQTRSEQSGGSPDCRLCPASIEGNKQNKRH